MEFELQALRTLITEKTQLCNQLRKEVFIFSYIYARNHITKSRFKRYQSPLSLFTFSSPWLRGLKRIALTFLSLKVQIPLDHCIILFLELMVLQTLQTVQFSGTVLFLEALESLYRVCNQKIKQNYHTSSKATQKTILIIYKQSL